MNENDSVFGRGPVYDTASSARRAVYDKNWLQKYPDWTPIKGTITINYEGHAPIEIDSTEVYIDGVHVAKVRTLLHADGGTGAGRFRIEVTSQTTPGMNALTVHEDDIDLILSWRDAIVDTLRDGVSDDSLGTSVLAIQQDHRTLQQRIDRFVEQHMHALRQPR